MNLFPFLLLGGINFRPSEPTPVVDTLVQTRKKKKFDTIINFNIHAIPVNFPRVSSLSFCRSKPIGSVSVCIKRTANNENK